MVAQLDPLYVKSRPTKVVPRLLSYALFEGRPLTTRGQWINPLVFAHFALEMRLPQLKRVREPIFIVGTGRSGSTMLGVTLSMHREVGFLNEPKALWHAVYPGADVFAQYSEGPARYSLDESDASEEVRRRAHRLFGAYLRVVASSRVVDKYPELLFRIPFVKTIFPDARFILLVRNGWDTCRSIEGWSRRKGARMKGETHDWWGKENRKWDLMVKELVPKEKTLAPVVDTIRDLNRHSDMAAVEWILTMQEGLRQLGRDSDSMHMLRYESLITNPRQELTSLQRFCNLPHDDVFLNFGAQKAQPLNKGEPFDLHPVLRQPFENTLKALGY